MSSKSLSDHSHIMLLLAVIFAFGFLGWLNTPAVDYDEALYAQMAREMLATGEWFQPLWDSRPLYDKPPTFIWTLLPFVGLDAMTNGHSGAFRIGNLLASLFIAYGSSRLIRRTQKEQAWTHLAPALYFCALFPSLGAGLLLIDLTLCVFFFVAFAVLDDCFLRSKGGIIGRPTRMQSIILGLAITAAAATKGLIGGIIPALATLAASLHLGSYRKPHRIIALTVAQLWIPALIALAGSFLFYFFMWQAGHQDFVRSFFLDHHFGRGSAAMEGHGGPLFYHWVIVWIGGGWLIAALLRLLSLHYMSPVSPETNRQDKVLLQTGRTTFALSWILMTVSFFSLLATKLPNYTWPVWLAVPVAVARLAEELTETRHGAFASSKLSAGLQLIATLGGSLTTLLGTALAAVPVVLSFQTQLSALDPRVLAIITATPMRTSESWACFGAGAILAATGVAAIRTSLAKNSASVLGPAPKIALLNGALMIVLLWGVAPYAKRAYHRPLADAGNLAANKSTELPVFTFGLKSPTFSGAYGFGSGQISNPHITQHGDDSRAGLERDPDAAGRLLIVPSWAEFSCPDMDAAILGRIAFLQLCKQEFSLKDAK